MCALTYSVLDNLYQALGTQLVVQINAFSLRSPLIMLKCKGEDENCQCLPERILIKAHLKGIPIGLQEAYPFSEALSMKAERLTGSKLKRLREEILHTLTKLDVSYVEVYPQDLQDPFWRALWRELATVSQKDKRGL